MRKTLTLGELKPNPFKKEIQNGRIDPLVVKQIVESAGKTSFWEQWVARKNGDGYEIAFGHHRLTAAIEMFGKKYEVSVQVELYTDEQMLIALADENAGSEATVRERIDTVLLAQRYLMEHPKNPSSRTTGNSRGPLPEPTSVRQVAEFLGEENWSKDTVSDALLLSKLDPKVLDKIAPIGTTHPSRKQMLSVKAALALTEIENKKTQIAVATEILSEPSEMGFQDIQDIIEEAKQEPTPERAAETARKATNKGRQKAQARKSSPFAGYRSKGRQEEPESEEEDTTLSISALKKYAKQIVDAGRREIARKIHPDKQTGDNEEMVSLNAAADWLKRLIEEAS